MPHLIMIAGPHGVGKSALMAIPTGARMAAGKLVDPQRVYEHLIEHYEENDHLPIPKKDFSHRAAERSFSNRFDHIRKGNDVTAICSLGSIEDLDLMDAARKNGYHIAFYFFGVSSWKRCMEHIRQTKNHWLSQLTEQDIFGDYHRAIAMLPGAIIQAHTGIIYDHTNLSRPKPLLEIENGRIQIIEKNLPEWVLEPLSRCL